MKKQKIINKILKVCYIISAFCMFWLFSTTQSLVENFNVMLLVIDIIVIIFLAISIDIIIDLDK